MLFLLYTSGKQSLLRVGEGVNLLRLTKVHRLIGKGLPEIGMQLVNHPRLAKFTKRERKYFFKAVRFDLKYHLKRLRKSGESSFFHDARVALLLLEAGFDALTVIASLMHEAIEDDHKTWRWIAKKFGKDVADIVVAVSKRPRNDQDPQDHRHRTQAHVRTMRKAIFKNFKVCWRIIPIKGVDRLTNATDTYGLSEEDKIYLFTETVKYMMPFFWEVVPMLPKREYRRIAKTWLVLIMYACDHYKNSLKI